MVRMESGEGAGVNNQPGDWRQPDRGVKREEWEVRQVFATSEAILGRCSCDSDEERRGFELDF